MEYKVPRPIALLCEMIPMEGQQECYLNLAKSLLPELEKIPGFISIERFQSLNNPEKILSLSYWTDIKAVQQWKNQESQRDVQAKGGFYLFRNYHLSIVEVVNDFRLSRPKKPIFHGKPKYIRQVKEFTAGKHTSLMTVVR